MIVHRCDVCEAEFLAGHLTPVMVRCNLERIAKDAPTHVEGTIDLCEKVECRRKGIVQIMEHLKNTALRKAGLVTDRSITAADEGKRT